MTLSLPKIAIAACSLLALAACNSETGGRNPARAYTPIPGDTLSLMAQKNTDRSAPVLIRAFKKESEIEVWKQAKDGRYVLLKSYPVCRWSGQLGPKKREGDRQVPEGFYTVSAGQMNPNSAYWLSFNVGYPNPLERSLGRGGGDIMVHGTCSSRGCFAMTDKQIEEIYAVMREAFNGGQKSVQFQSYPFRMTAENLAKFRHDPNIAFWRNLKDGNDHFEVTKAEPRVGYCGGKYVFNAESGRNDPATPCSSLAVDPSVASAVASKQRQDDQRVAELVQRGTPAVRVQYADGGQNPAFNNSGYGSYDTQERVVLADATPQRSLGDVSRPEAINDVEEYAVDERGNRRAAKAETAVAAAAASAVSPTVTATLAPSSNTAKPGVKPVVQPVKAPQAVAAAAPSAAPAASGPAVTAAAVVPAAKPTGTFSAIGALFGSSPGAEPQAEVAKAGPKPFYKKWFSLGAEEQETAAPPAEAAPAPASVPLPPKRQAAADGKQKIALLPTETMGASEGQ